VIDRAADFIGFVARKAGHVDENFEAEQHIAAE
jgi:hypothetical protein